MDKLLEYKHKRNQARTPEPFESKEAAFSEKDGADPSKTKDPKGLSFCVQLHDARRLHYDLRLEWDGVLLSWAVPKGFSYNPKDKRLAVKVEDHPLSYADFEGVIPRGEYGAGAVILWDEGEWIPSSSVTDAIKNGELKFELRGKRLKGKWAMVKMSGEQNEGKDNWLLFKEQDEYASTKGQIKYTTSIKSGRSLKETEDGKEFFAKRNPFNEVSVQLAKLADKVPSQEGFIYEIKYDGYRIVAFCENGKVRLSTRNSLDYTDKFPLISQALESLSAGRAMVLDGELIVTDEKGRSDFSALQSYAKAPSGKNISYMVFDLLALNGQDLRSHPLIKRKSMLQELLKECPPEIAYSRHVEGRGQAFFDAAAKMQLEGIVGKKADSVYVGGRNGAWIKIKCRPRQEFVVCGYTRTEKKTQGVSALLLGVYINGQLTYVGRVGSGLSRSNEALEKSLSELSAEKSPFKEDIKVSKSEKVFWLKPKIVAEIEYAELINGKTLRQASFKGLREDKSAKEVVLEAQSNSGDSQAENVKAFRSNKSKSELTKVSGIIISSPNKLIYKQPDITKLEVAEYYEKVADRMLPYIKNRLLSVVRCHKGVSGECFFKKHPAIDGEGVSIEMINSKGEKTDYFYLQDKSGLINQVQLGTLEFHVWASSVEAPDNPNMMVFDLDPDEGMELEQIRVGVSDLKKLLDSLSLKSFLKTSGGKGYHVVVPFKATSTWEAFSDFAQKIAVYMEKDQSMKYTSNIRKNNRKNKIFIDWIRNVKGATGIAPYSLRARVGARVSMPIFWEELKEIAPDGIDISEAVNRLSSADPWSDYFSVKQELK